MPLPAPVRLSITSCWPSVSLMWAPTRRAVMSAAEPGGKPMISRSGCDGKSPARAPGAAATAVSAMTSVRISAHTARRCIARPPLALFLRRVARCGDFGGIILCRAAARGDVAYWHSAARCGVTKALQLKRRRQAARSQGPARTVRHTRAHHAMLVLILRSAQRKGCGRLQYGCARLEGGGQAGGLALMLRDASQRGSPVEKL